MNLKLYMDEQVSMAITEGLRERGVDVITAQEDGLAQRADPEILDRATALGRVLFTQDRHLLQEAALRQRENRPFAGIIYVHPLTLTIGQCIRDLELAAKACDAKDFSNKLEYLPL